MAWTSSDDPFAQIRLPFPTLAAAVGYAERQGLDYRVIEPPPRRLVRKDYRETILGPAFWKRQSECDPGDCRPQEKQRKRREVQS